MQRLFSNAEDRKPHGIATFAIDGAVYIRGGETPVPDELFGGFGVLRVDFFNNLAAAALQPLIDGL